MEKGKLRIGVLFDEIMIPLWSYKMIEAIKSKQYCELILALRNKPEKKSKKNTFEKISKYSEAGLFWIWSMIDKRLSEYSPDAFEPKNLKDLLSADTTYISIQMNNDHLNESELEAIKKYKLDILIRIGFSPCNKKLTKVARFGIWSFNQFENDLIKEGPAGIREVLQGTDETEIILQTTIGNRKKAIFLDKTSFSTDCFSINRNRNNYYWKALSIMPIKIQELHHLGEELFFEKVKALNKRPNFNSKKEYSTPTNKEMLTYAPKLIFQKIKNKIDFTFHYYQWILMFGLGSTNKISTEYSRFQKMIPPKDRFWADPFVISRNGKYYIFIEELIYKENKGYICLIEMDELGNYTEPVKVLEQNYHLSYPFLIEDNGELYMIPESKQNNTIELYKCTNFPLKWELEKVLMNNIKAVDSTILFKDNKYWLFCNITQSPGPSAQDELCLFYSDTLISDTWKSHPLNPIVSDFKKSRPAGKLFSYKNKLYRPSQNGLKHYGYGMKINQVIELNETTYKEKEVDSIYPEWDDHIIATHTLNSADNLTIIDARIRRKKQNKILKRARGMAYNTSLLFYKLKTNLMLQTLSLKWPMVDLLVSSLFYELV
ncbi:hypothetical protein SAMN05421813_11340 [Daejeonella rubra]|uniref:Glucosamine inositolphosphorylceramide transferase 1 N-terminal domain-containing protein n=1 Tax=Daejeonella rubra TaxID=990371 RepID=A0A1G9TJ06_9SPHI|nr:hypothetical protein [Daejeonella rubra]SDM47643.1 hypothetical protein SAMN05421813_11340 [Daejeonella rubra]